MLVKFDEVKAAVRLADPGGLTACEVWKALQTRHEVVLALIRNGHLAHFRARNPVHHYTQSFVASAELERFKKTFVSLHMLAREREQHFIAVKKELDTRGVEPAFDHKKIGARFYRRSQLTHQPYDQQKES